MNTKVAKKLYYFTRIRLFGKNMMLSNLLSDFTYLIY